MRELFAPAGLAATTYFPVKLSTRQQQGSLSALTSASAVKLAAIAFAAGLLASCASLSRLPAVPSELTDKAVIPGIPNARFWFDLDLEPLVEQVRRDAELERKALAAEGKPTHPMPPAYF